MGKQVKKPSPPKSPTAGKAPPKDSSDILEKAALDFFFCARVSATGLAVIFVLGAPLFFGRDTDLAPFYFVLLSLVVVAVPFWVLWFWVTKRECPGPLKAVWRLILSAIYALLFISQ